MFIQYRRRVPVHLEIAILSTSAPASADRAALIRQALLHEVAAHGLHGTSMAAVARRAGVATGSAYTYYPGKDALVVATYVDAKRRLAAAAVAGLDETDDARHCFLRVWHNVHVFAREEVETVTFFQQIESTPLAATAQAEAAAASASLHHVVERAVIAATLVDLPLKVLFELGLGPALRLAAADIQLSAAQLQAVAEACWRAISRDAR